MLSLKNLFLNLGRFEIVQHIKFSQKYSHLNAKNVTKLLKKMVGHP